MHGSNHQHSLTKNSMSSFRTRHMLHIAIVLTTEFLRYSLLCRDMGWPWRLSPRAMLLPRCG